MPHRLAHIQEMVITLLGVVYSGVNYIVLATASQTEAEALRWSLLPLLGGLLACGGAFLLSQDREQNRIVVGRTIFALVACVISCKVASLIPISDALSSIITDPLILVGIGFTAGVIWYFLSKPIVVRLAKQAPATADDLIDNALKLTADHLKGMGLRTPSIIQRWPVPPEPDSPDYQDYQALLQAELARMAAEAKKYNK